MQSRSHQSTVSPAAIAANGTVTASWSGITAPSATDWIGLFVPERPRKLYRLDTKLFEDTGRVLRCWIRVRSGFPTSHPGTYELPLVLQQWFSLLATSNVITATP